MSSPQPLPHSAAWSAVGRCVARSVVMLGQGEVRWPREHVGRMISFADGTFGRVYRETAVNGPPPVDSCVLVVAFRLRWVRGRGHVAFEKESVLNTPLFVGFPGFVSKLWLAHDDHGRYRGLYEWDGSTEAEQYARSLWRVLELVSERDSIDFRVLPGLRRDEVLADPASLESRARHEEEPWWRVVELA